MRELFSVDEVDEHKMLEIVKRIHRVTLILKVSGDTFEVNLNTLSVITEDNMTNSFATALSVKDVTLYYGI